MKTILVAKGKKVTRVDVAVDAPTEDALAAMLLGPTGNLRAPTMKVGSTMLVGFNAEMYEDGLA